jgi:hypothetical protein
MKKFLSFALVAILFSFTATAQNGSLNIFLQTGISGEEISQEALDAIAKWAKNNRHSGRGSQNSSDKNDSMIAYLISEITGSEVGLMINKSSGEYPEPKGLYLKDALNAEVIQQIAAHAPNGIKILLITHSIGNKDAIKATQLLAIQNVNLDKKIDVISINSPVSQEQIRQAFEPVGINLIGQY